MLKGLERIVQWFILEHVIDRPLFRQHAYTKGRSCETALSTFVNSIERSIYNGEHTLAVSLDCSGAFDCIKFDSAKESMVRAKIPKNITKWYCNLLKSRCVSADIQGLRAHIRPARGSPQGGVLSPLIWNLIMDGFLTKYERGPVKVLGYADDVLVYICGSNISTMTELLQPALDSVVEWGRENGLSFNPLKTTTVLFSRRRRISNYPEITLDGKVLEYSNSLRYLGVTIHKQLSWLPHVRDRTNKCKFLLGKCRNIVSQSWGLTPERADWIHKAVIRPKITYGSIVWAHTITAGIKARLTRVQRLGLLPITQPLRSAPTAGLETMVGWIPLDLHAQQTGLIAYFRLKHNLIPGWDGLGRKTTQKGHLRIWKDTLSGMIDPNYPVEEVLNTHLWRQHIDHIHNKGWGSPLRIYTDASKTGDNVGYGWIATDGDYIVAEEIYSAKEIEVHRAEVLAIKEALSWLKNCRHPGRETIISSDSQSAVSALNGYVIRDNTTKTTMELLIELDKTDSVELVWVRGHNNTTGNEVADMLARVGAEEARRISYSSPFTPASFKRMKITINQGFIKLWQSRWNHTDLYRVSKLFLPTVQTNTSLLKMSIKELQRLSQIITGHGLYKRHLRHWNELDDYQCALCDEGDEDSFHLWQYCPSLKQERELSNNLLKSGVSFARVVLKFFSCEKIKQLMASNEASLRPE